MDVTLDNADEVYAYYAQHRQPLMRARAAYGYLAWKYRPRVVYEAGARDKIRAVLNDDVRLVICANHVSDCDQFILAATAFVSPLRRRIGHVRVLAKDELFVEPKQRAKIDMMGGIPVFRPKNHQMRAAVAAGRQMIDICVARAAEFGDSIAVFPEGTRNLEHPDVLLPIASGIGHIAAGIARRAEVALLPIGIAYPDETRVGATVFIGVPSMVAVGATPASVTRDVRTRLQGAVDEARSALPVADAPWPDTA